MERKYGVLSNYEPTYLDKMRYWMQDALTPYMGGDAKRAGAFVQDKVMPTAEFLPGIGDAMGIAEAADEFNQGNYGTAGMLGSLATIGMVPGVGDVAQKAGKKAIRAYHGSPHDFDKFSLDKIGTGEGAQAYGHGLYFAESEGVAKSYRDALSGGVKQGLRPSQYKDVTKWSDEAKMLFPDDPKRQAAFQYLNQLKNKDSALRDFDFVSGQPFNKGKFSWPDADGNEVAFTRDELASLADEFYNPGRMYEVNINADPNDFLDWDKPLSEQPEIVNKILEKNGMTEQDAITQSMRYKELSEQLVNGADARGPIGDEWDALRQNPITKIGDLLSGERSPKYVTGETIGRHHEKVLKEAGIPGIKYLDAGSRGAGDGSRNYVVFDDALIEILRKYGLAGLGIGAGAGGFGSLSPQDENYQPPVL